MKKYCLPLNQVSERYDRNTTSKSTKNLWQADQAIDWLMRERRQALRQNCFIYENNSSISEKEVPRFIAIKKIKALYLQVPKVGCTNWKKIVMLIEG